MVKYYSLAERPKKTDLNLLGFDASFTSPRKKPILSISDNSWHDSVIRVNHAWLSPFQPGRVGIAAKLAGEKRPPKRGEWYLSGAIPQAYRAPKDLTTPYQIVTLVTVQTTITTKEMPRSDVALN